MRNDTTRSVLVAYAILAGCAGFIAFAWPNLFLRADQFDLGDIYLGRGALLRVFGAILMGSGCFAAAFVKVDDPRVRRDGLLWLAGALGIVCLVLTTQVLGPWGPGVGQRAALALGFVTLALVAAATSPDRYGPAISLRSQYEQQIRRAAGQEERKRLARDLHDSIKQQIFAIHTSAATAQVRFDTDPAGTKEALEQVRGSAREAMTEMEAMLDQLRAVPLENAGLIEALKKQCEALGFRTGANVDFKLGPLPANEELPPGAQQAIFRVAQEALANVGRHARAKNVVVSLDSHGGSKKIFSPDRWVDLKVDDDGAGFDLAHSRRGMGTANMQARAEELGGEFDQVSRAGAGTSVRLSIPCVRRQPPTWLVGIIWSFASATSVLLIFHARESPWLFLWPLATVIIVRWVVDYHRGRKLGETSS